MSNDTFSDGGLSPNRLQQYHGARVSVYYTPQTGYVDSGQLTYMGEQFIEITKDNGERLLAPINSIRIVKLIEPSQVHDDSDVLLRPAENHPEQKVICR